MATPLPPPLNFKKKPITAEEKVNFGNAGAAIARSDALVAAVRSLQQNEFRQMGFDIGMGATGGDTLWGPGKQKILQSLDFEQQIGFREASTFAMIRNNEPVLSSKGADIAKADPQVETARKGQASGLFWLGFDIATAIFGDPALGALGNTAMGAGAEKFDLSWMRWSIFCFPVVKHQEVSTHRSRSTWGGSTNEYRLKVPSMCAMPGPSPSG